MLCKHTLLSRIGMILVLVVSGHLATATVLNPILICLFWLSTVCRHRCL